MRECVLTLLPSFLFQVRKRPAASPADAARAADEANHSTKKLREQENAGKG